MGEVSPDEARTIAQQFQADLEDGLYIRLAVETMHYTMALNWISQFNTSLRTLDGLHLAVAVANRIPLVTADQGLADGAEVLGAEVQMLRLLNEE